MDYPNYIEGRNPFKLAGPPKTFQRALWDFDKSLVVVPAIKYYHYHLAQRVKNPDLSVNIAREAMKYSPDTIQLTNYSLVPVTSILPTVNWHDTSNFFRLLSLRSPQMWGGVDKYMDKIEDNELQVKLAKDAEIDDMLNILAKDSWKFYRKKEGLGRTWHQQSLNPQYS